MKKWLFIQISPINHHFTNYSELTKISTSKDSLLVRQEGNRQVQRNIAHYNLDMIIALGYRVQSQVATRFRRWATQRLHEYIQKGFAMDDERLKQTAEIVALTRKLNNACLSHFQMKKHKSAANLSTIAATFCNIIIEARF